MSKHKANARVVFNDGTVKDYVAGNGQSAFGCYNLSVFDKNGKNERLLSFQKDTIKEVIDLTSNKVVYKPPGKKKK